MNMRLVILLFTFILLQSCVSVSTKSLDTASLVTPERHADFKEKTKYYNSKVTVFRQRALGGAACNYALSIDGAWAEHFDTDDKAVF